jgi:TonB family protein
MLALAALVLKLSTTVTGLRHPPTPPPRPAGAPLPVRYYPERAQRLGITGEATIRCQLNADRTLTGCSVIAEDPKDWGFADAAKVIVRAGYRIPVSTMDNLKKAWGQLDSTDVELSLDFILKDKATPAGGGSEGGQ